MTFKVLSVIAAILDSSL